jgi:hypothetical protein
LAATFFAAAFLAGVFFGSSGCSSRRMPSWSALRRTLSACASWMLEEWLFTPMPNCSHKSSSSLFVRPSSFASSWTLGFLGKDVPSLRRKFLRSPNGQRFLVSRSQTATQEIRSDALDFVLVDRRPQRLRKSTTPDGELEAPERPGAEPGTPTGQCTADSQRSILPPRDAGQLVLPRLAAASDARPNRHSHRHPLTNSGSPWSLRRPRRTNIRRRRSD